MEENILFVKAEVPEALIPNSYASSSAVGWTMYQKFANAMPLYRQEQDDRLEHLTPWSEDVQAACQN